MKVEGSNISDYIKRSIKWHALRLVRAVERNEYIKAFGYSEKIKQMIETLISIEVKEDGAAV